MKNFNEETPSDICTYSNITELLGGNETKTDTQEGQNICKFVPSYIKNAPLNAQVELGSIRIKQPDFLSMPKTALPTAQNDGKFLPYVYLYCRPTIKL